MSGVDSDITNASAKSTQTFLTSLITNSAIAGAEFTVFLVLSRYWRLSHIYEPRTKLPPESKRQRHPLPNGILNIIPAIIMANDEDIILQNGLDAYLFVRFLKLMMWIFAPISLVTWIILLPIYGTSTGANVGLNQFTFGNVSTSQQGRLAAPLIIVWFSTFYILFIIKREWELYVHKRQDFLSSRAWSTKAQARTVLLTGIPDDYCNLERLETLTRHLPGGVRKVWLARDVKELADFYDRRQKATKKLESANMSIIKQANKLVRKKKVDITGDREKNDSVASRYVAEKKRPTHRLSKIPFTGKKVDTIDWALEEIQAMNQQLEEKRKDISRYPPKSSAFILFNDQIGAHVFAQCLLHELPLSMSGRFINVSPNDIIWRNTNVEPLFARLRTVASLAATCAIIIFWSLPTAFVTSISNVSNLCADVHWLSWLCDLPVPINGIVQGILPPVLLMLLFMLLPPVFKFLSMFAGTPMRTLVEHSLQKRYFAFLFVQGFLVATLSSGIVASIQQITDNPTSTVSLLAQNLPKASIFFLTLVVTNGLSGAASGILQVLVLVLYYVRIVLLGGSPRSVQKIRFRMQSTSWGTTFPGQSLNAVIALAYSTIAPLVCGFALLTFSLWWFCWKYLFLWVYDQPADKETGGLFFKTAINQLFVGLYIEHLCLIGLFFLARNEEGKVSALPQAILMIILLVTTIFVHITLDSGFSPLSQYLPLSMADQLDDNEGRYAREMAEEKRQAELQQQQNKGVFGRLPTDSPRSDSETAPVYTDEPGDRSGLSDEQHLRGTEDWQEREDGGAGYPPARHQAHNERQEEQEEEDLEELEGGLSDHAFHHPALYKGQPMIWLPKDDLGISEEAVRNARARNIKITNDDAVIDAKGDIDIFRDTIPGTEFDE